MKTIRIDLDVWAEIAKRGEFGETPNHVLRRVFNLKLERFPSYREKRATNKLSPHFQNNRFILSFASGSTQSWPLPSKDDKKAIRHLRDKTVAFVRESMGTYGQMEAAKKALTQAGYYLTK